MAQPAQGEPLQLTYPLPREGELPADLLQGARHAVEEAEAQLQDPPLARGELADEAAQESGGLRVGHLLSRVCGVGVLDEVAEPGAVIPHGLLKRARPAQTQRRLDLGE